MTSEFSLQGIVKVAAAKEAEAYAFYADAAGKAQNPGARSLLRELADDELEHKEHLETLDPTQLPEPDGDAVKSLGISEFLVERPIRAHAAFQDIMIHAMKREERAERFFADLADAMPDGDLKRLFVALRDEETQHKARLEQLYDEIVYKEN